MPTHYRVTLELTQKQFLEFVDGAPKMSVVIEAIHPVAEPAPVAPPAPVAKAKRPPRGSKVNDAILAKLSEGPAQPSALRDALVEAGLSAGSLSTGLAILQKEGRVGRHGDGLYVLAA